MADPKGNVNQHIISTLLGRRANLVQERKLLKKAEARLAEISPEIEVIEQELKDRGHVDPDPE
jgi:hypothetical protein